MKSFPGAGRARLLLPLAVPLLLISGLAGGLLLFQRAPRAAQASGQAALPSGMPTHFSFGLMDAPGGASYLAGMRSNNGTAWDFRYQYLAGGVNTGSGWSTWNWPSGQFATNYMNESGTNGFTPAFVYYQIQQSNGPSGGSEAGNDLAHLASPSTMNAYYADWALLMQKISAYGHTTLVIVEPDLWGFLQQAALAKGSNSAVSIPASVSSSGYPDAQGLPNTAQGFAWALLKIRDHYAPNALLALHASSWSTSVDVNTNTTPNINAAAIGTKTGQFLNTAGLVGNPAGISSFDLVSNDIADHDSGQSGIWWDRYNVTYPNFSRYLRFASALSATTGRRIVMWQVPVGNQYFSTENNSPGHTQDNKAEYIISHVAQFASAGVIGVLFGPGNGGTYATDARHDGVTNAAPIVTYECNRCNTHTSTYADDDGGYLRIFLGQYYRSGGYPLGGGPSPSPTPTSTSSPGQPTPTATIAPTATSTPPGPCQPSVAFGSTSGTPATLKPGTSVAISSTMTVQCARSGVVDFEVYNQAGQKIWQSFQSNATFNGQPQTFSATWTTPSTLPSGTYTIKIGVFGPYWSPLYGWNNNAATLTVSGGSATGCAGSPTVAFASAPANPVSLTAGGAVPLSVSLTSSCPASALIDFEIYNQLGQKIWQTWQDSTPLTGQPQMYHATWTPESSLPGGTYTLKAGVFGPGWSPLYGWDNAVATYISTASTSGCATPPVISFTAAAATPESASAGQTVALSASITSSCATSALFDFEIYNAGGQKVWQTWQDHTPLSGATQTFTANWLVPAGQAAGTYTLKLGVFGPGWTPLYGWDNGATTITIQ